MKRLAIVIVMLSALAVLGGRAFAQEAPSGNLSIVAPAEAAPVAARLHVWTPVPGLSTGVASTAGDNLEIAVSAEMYQAGGAVWFRALVDGKVVEPSDVQFKAGTVNFDGVRSFTFVATNVSAGQHLVEIQWLTGSPASIRDRTLMVHSAAPAAGRDRLAVAAGQSGPNIVKSTDTYEDIPGLETRIVTTGPSTLAVAFSAEAGALAGQMFVRAMVNGVAMGETTFVQAGNGERGGTRSFTFAQADLPAGAHHIVLQWRAQRGRAWIGDRTMAVSAVHGSSQQANPVAQTPLIVPSGTWVNVHPGASIATNDPVTNVAVTFSTETRSSNGRIFLRAFIDDRLLSPGDVTLIQGGSSVRSTSHTFVLKNVPAGSHRIRIQAMADPATIATFGNRSMRVLWKRRAGPDFAQPYLGMAPLQRKFPLLVICFDPVRPGHARPNFDQIKAIFEGRPTEPRGLNVRDWMAENGGAVAGVPSVRYLGCGDDNWYVAAAQRRGDWYWTQPGGFELMWRDALAAADADIDFHAFDTDKNNHLSYDEVVVNIVRPQSSPAGFARSTITPLDGIPAPMDVPLVDIYLSSNPLYHREAVGLAAHEISHFVFGALDLYGVCPDVSSGYYSVMDAHWRATHLDPFEKMKNGLVAPTAIDLSQQQTDKINLVAVESGRQILLLLHPARVDKEYFLIENRFPGVAPNQNYDAALGTGAVVVWQIFEDRNLTNASDICAGDVRFIRRRATLSQPSHSFDLRWSDGESARFRVTAPVANAETATILLEKF